LYIYIYIYIYIYAHYTITHTLDRFVRVYSFDTGRNLGVIETKSNVTHVDFSQSLLLASFVDKTVRLYDMDTFECTRVSAKRSAHSLPITYCRLERSSVAVNDEGDVTGEDDRVWTASLDGLVKNWRPDTLQCVDTFKPKNDVGGILALELWRERNCFITGSVRSPGEQGCVAVWDRRVGTTVGTTQLECHGLCSVSVDVQSHSFAVGASSDALLDRPIVVDTNPTSGPVLNVCAANALLLSCQPEAICVFQTQQQDTACNELPYAYKIEQISISDLYGDGSESSNMRTPPRGRFRSNSRDRGNHTAQHTPLAASTSNQQQGAFCCMRYNQATQVMAVGTTRHVLVWGGKSSVKGDHLYRPRYEDRENQLRLSRETRRADHAERKRLEREYREDRLERERLEYSNSSPPSSGHGHSKKKRHHKGNRTKIRSHRNKTVK
jgi:hypothetical protein